MREPIRIPEAALIQAVEAGYGLPVRALTFLPLGADSASAAYRIQAAGGAVYFLKARVLSGFRPASLLVPAFLHEQGVPHLLAPIPTKAGSAWIRLTDYALSLFPLVEGRMGAEAGLSEDQWTALGAAVRQIHSIQLPPDLLALVPRETFIPSRREVLDRLQAAIDSRGRFDPVGDELAEFWTSRQEKIRALVARADELTGQLREAPAARVLCHGDLHTWNILVDSAESLWLVDWDETILALKERDLMFVIGGIGRGLVAPEETACFLQGYGETGIDKVALAYYRYAWAVQDMGAYGEQVCFSPGLGEATRRDALEGFKSLFAPGNIADIALGTGGGVR